MTIDAEAHTVAWKITDNLTTEQIASLIADGKMGTLTLAEIIRLSGVSRDTIERCRGLSGGFRFPNPDCSIGYNKRWSEYAYLKWLDYRTYKGKGIN